METLPTNDSRCFDQTTREALSGQIHKIGKGILFLMTGRLHTSGIVFVCLFRLSQGDIVGLDVRMKWGPP